MCLWGIRRAEPINLPSVHEVPLDVPVQAAHLLSHPRSQALLFLEGTSGEAQSITRDRWGGTGNTLAWGHASASPGFLENIVTTTGEAGCNLRAPASRVGGKLVVATRTVKSSQPGLMNICCSLEKLMQTGSSRQVWRRSSGWPWARCPPSRLQTSAATRWGPQEWNALC